MKPQTTDTPHTSSLGAFSVSLAVKDLAASKAFYAKLGFEPFAGQEDQGWLIMSNGPVKIGVFQGMFPSNILTFNPGWNAEAGPLENYTDVRKVQRDLKEKGLEIMDEADEDGKGPANFMVADPDGNVILFDQHV